MPRAAGDKHAKCNLGTSSALLCEYFLTKLTNKDLRIFWLFHKDRSRWYGDCVATTLNIPNYFPVVSPPRERETRCASSETTRVRNDATSFFRAISSLSSSHSSFRGSLCVNVPRLTGRSSAAGRSLDPLVQSRFEATVQRLVMLGVPRRAAEHARIRVLHTDTSRVLKP